MIVSQLKHHFRRLPILLLVVFSTHSQNLFAQDCSLLCDLLFPPSVQPVQPILSEDSDSCDIILIAPQYSFDGFEVNVTWELDGVSAGSGPTTTILNNDALEADSITMIFEVISTGEIPDTCYCPFTTFFPELIDINNYPWSCDCQPGGPPVPSFDVEYIYGCGEVEVLFYNTTVEEQLYDLEWTFGVDANTITSNEIDYGLTFVTVDDNSILPLPVALTVIDTNGCQGVIEENITIPNSPNLCDSIDFTLDVMGTDSCDITVGINPIEFQYDTAAYDLTINYSWLASDPAFLQIVGDNNATINNSYALTQENLTLTIEIILESIVDPAQSITCVCSEEYSLTDIVDEYEYFSCDCQPGGPPIADFNVFNEGECGNQGIAFENNSTGGLGSNYEWSFGNNGEYGQSFESSPTVDIIVDGGMSSEVPVNLTITDANGCESSVTQNVAVLQTPNPGTDLEILPICTSLSDDESETVILTFTPEPFFQFGIDQISIDWGLGETLFYTAPPFQPTFEIESPGYDTIGVYYINLELLGLNGCITTINEELFVGNNPQIGSANPGNTDGLCSPVELTFPITNFIQNEISTVY